MELRPSFQIPALIKSLTDVVLPAVDPANKLAQEQGQLVVAMLHLMAQRLPLQYHYDCHELKQFLGLADSLAAHGAALPELGESLAALATDVEAGRAVLSRAGVAPAELEATNLALRTSVGAAISASAMAADGPDTKAINAAVMAHAQEMLLRERAWLAMQGWEGPNAGLPAVETLIGD
ncbi:hypothetical protein [Nevskia sp.]|uniref:hypothetical protein n=1 Tax=Nevskia sp. TaxID=1929292 RepID=UPI0025FA5090|nr:hypothetical protein [Nevskia sp.]